MHIGIIGAGSVGRAVGAGWAAKGHEVVYGVREPAKSQEPGVSRTVAETAADAEVVVLTVMFHAVEAALRDCDDLSGKILLDPTNPLAPDEGGLKLSLGYETSVAEFIAARTAATVVKSLNQAAQGVAPARTAGDGMDRPGASLRHAGRPRLGSDRPAIIAGWGDRAAGRR
jgi:8-hydroxy-5-deazaflavin:NADPH oxidoreductase